MSGFLWFLWFLAALALLRRVLELPRPFTLEQRRALFGDYYKWLMDDVRTTPLWRGMIGNPGSNAPIIRIDAEPRIDDHKNDARVYVTTFSKPIVCDERTVVDTELSFRLDDKGVMHVDQKVDVRQEPDNYFGREFERVVEECMRFALTGGTGMLRTEFIDPARILRMPDITQESNTMRIVPTVSRMVHVFLAGIGGAHDEQPNAGIVAFVHSYVGTGPYCINVAAFNNNAIPYPCLSIPLVQPELGDQPPAVGEYAMWMPYQLGQAARAEAAEAKAAVASSGVAFSGETSAEVRRADPTPE